MYISEIDLENGLKLTMVGLFCYFDCVDLKNGLKLTVLSQLRYCVCTGILHIRIVVLKQLKKLWDGGADRST